METPDTYVSALGVFLPAPMSVDAAVADGRYPAAAVQERGLLGAAVAGDVSAPEMALHAARSAYDRAPQAPSDVDLLLYADAWHQGPDGWQPQSYLQRHLVGGETLAVEVRQGCNGMFGALELAAAYLRARPGPASALLVAADNFGTPLLDRWSADEAFLPGDAASAMVLSSEPGMARLLAVGSTTIPDAEEVHRAGEPLFPPGATVGRPVRFTDRAEVFRRESRARPGGSAAMIRVQAMLPEIVDRTLSEADVKLNQVARVAFPHFAREIIEYRALAALRLPVERSTWDFGRRLGHLGASDQVVALNHLLDTGQLSPGDHFVMVGIGPGVTLACAVLQILAVPAPRADDRAGR